MKCFKNIFLENLPIGSEVYTVKAYDSEDLKVSYQIVGGSGLGSFSIDRATGL
jgi:hypothetical protein